MPYGNVNIYRADNTVLIKIELPDSGEPSIRGFAENLVDPSQWFRYEDVDDHLALKLTLCRPTTSRSRQRRRRW